MPLFVFAAVAAGIVLVLGGTHPAVALGAVVPGVVVSGLVWLILLVVGMSYSAEQAGYSVRPSGVAVEPSAGYRAVGVLFRVFPPIIAIAATLLGGQLLEPNSAVPIIGAGAYLAVLWLLSLWDDHAWSARVDAQWLRNARAAATEDPEFAAELESRGVRVTAPRADDAAEWPRAVGEINRARREAGRPIVEIPDATDGGPRSPALIGFGLGSAFVVGILTFAPPGFAPAIVALIVLTVVGGLLARRWAEILLLAAGSLFGVAFGGALQLGQPGGPATVRAIFRTGLEVASFVGFVAAACFAVRWLVSRRR